MSASEKYAELADFSLSQAKHYKRQHNYLRAFPHYLVFAQLDKQKFQEEHISEFLSITHTLVNRLEKQGKVDKVEQVFQQAIEIVPSHPELLTNFGSFLFKQNQTERAERFFRTALEADPNFLTAKDRLENLSTSLVERWHFPMLNDISRNNSFFAAINRRVSEGCKTVLDIGTGTGILSLMASKAGAERVYTCEASEVMAVTARDVLQRNVEGERVKLIPKLSLDMSQEDVPEKVSLLVTETFDSGLLGEHVLETVLHAWRNFLAPDCHVVPARAEFYVVPVQSKSAVGRVEAKTVGYLECEGVRVTADMRGEGEMEDPYLTEDLGRLRGGYKMISSPQQIFSVSFENQEQIAELVEGKVFINEFIATVDCECDAVAGWFKLHLDQHEQISSEPGSGSCWEQVIFPVKLKNRKVYKNSRIELEFLVKKHLVLQRVVTSHIVEGNDNGVSDIHPVVSMDKHLIMPSDMVMMLNCKLWVEMTQWVSYYLARDMPCTTILDMTLQPPAIAVQVMKFKQTACLTMLVNQSNARSSKQMLDWVTTMAARNSVSSSSIDCITSLTPGSEYEVVLISPVLQSGRMNTDSFLEMESVNNCMSRTTNSTVARPVSLLLPFRLEVWCVVISSRELAHRSHLINNDPVLGFTIADQVNILAVAHQQEIRYKEMEKQELCAHTLVKSMELASVSLEREILVNNLTITTSGRANGVAYWFVLDYGWGVKLSTLDSDAYYQAMFLCKEVRVEEGERLKVRFQMERGLLDFQFCDPPIDPS